MVIAIEQFTTILTICVWFFSRSNGGEKMEDAPRNSFIFAFIATITKHFGTVLSGSFMVAVIWTLITMIIVYKEVIKSLMSHEKLEKIRD